MDSEAISYARYSGFIDYSSFFPVSDAVWIIVGVLITAGSVISVIPQISLIVKKRSSFGLNPITIFITNLNQCIILINIICLHPQDFTGLPSQRPWYKTLSRLLTFGSAFSLWIVYLPIVFLCHVFFDTSFRPLRDEPQMQHDKLFARMLSGLMPIVSTLLLATYLISVGLYGITNSFAITYGKTLGSLATVIVFVQYLPQMITTFKLKDNGSLSLLMLCIQAPGGLADVLFLWIGQGDDWTTWISYLVAALEQVVLIIMIVFFKCTRKHKAADIPQIVNDEMQEAIIDAPLIPQVFED